MQQRSENEQLRSKAQILNSEVRPSSYESIRPDPRQLRCRSVSSSRRSVQHLSARIEFCAGKASGGCLATLHPRCLCESSDFCQACTATMSCRAVQVLRLQRQLTEAHAGDDHAIRRAYTALVQHITALQHEAQV